MKARALRRLSRALDAVADRLGRLAALLEVAADSTPAAETPAPVRAPNACQFCGAPPGKAMCHGCPGVERGIA